MSAPGSVDRGALDRVAAQAHAAWAAADSPGGRAAAVAAAVLGAFDHYYARSRAIPAQAKHAFENRDWPLSVRLSAERIGIYRRVATEIAEFLRGLMAADPDPAGLWDAALGAYLDAIRPRYEGDLAYTFFQSVRRMVTRDAWRAIDYSYRRASGTARPRHAERTRIHRAVPFEGRVTPADVRAILAVPGLDAPWRDLDADAAAAAARINSDLGLDAAPGDGRFEIVDAGFYRNRGAYLVGRIVLAERTVPLALALLNEGGVLIDAVILDADHLRYVFSSTLANFHVTLEDYHELADFLHALMPGRPHGLHYSTVGFNHVGKGAVMRQILGEPAATGEALDFAVGSRGSVAIGFSAPSSRYVLKVIRDTAAASYKWGAYPGREHVLAKYRGVHRINRSGSLLDNVMYYNVALPRGLLADGLVDELLAAAPGSVRIDGEQVFFHHLIVQMKMIPLPVFLETATADEAEQAMLSLGRCIRNNAAANIFNLDLDGRNYGVGQTLKVYLFDYDAIERLTEVKVRTNADRIDGEEDIPDWFFEEGVVFLPEELEMHLRIPDRHLRQVFRAAHGEIFTAGYWIGMQEALRAGKVPRVATYPYRCRLRRG